MLHQTAFYDCAWVQVWTRSEVSRECTALCWRQHAVSCPWLTGKSVTASFTALALSKTVWCYLYSYLFIYYLYYLFICWTEKLRCLMIPRFVVNGFSLARRRSRSRCWQYCAFISGATAAQDVQDVLLVDDVSLQHSASVPAVARGQSSGTVFKHTNHRYWTTYKQQLITVQRLSWEVFGHLNYSYAVWIKYRSKWHLLTSACF